MRLLNSHIRARSIRQLSARLMPLMGILLSFLIVGGFPMDGSFGQTSKPKKKSKATSESFEAVSGPSVVAIDVTGNKKIEKDAILLKVKTKVGQPFSRETIQQDVVDVFKMGYFYNIEVEKESVSGGVKVIYKITEKPSIAEIKYNGNDEISEDDLKEASGIKPYEILNVNTLRLSVSKLEKLYEDKGYFLAKISYEIEDIEKGESVRLVYKIKENDKVKVKKITFLGNKYLKDGELKSPMVTKEEGFFSFLSGSGAYKQDAFDRDMQVLNYLYFNKGYVQVKIAKPEVYVTADKKSIFVTIRIEEGEQFNIGDIDFSGDLLFSKEELAQTIALKSGDIFGYEALQADLNSLQAKYGDLGYAFANILPRTNIREKDRLVDINFEIDKGQKVYFGEINVVGNSKTRDKVVRRELKVRETELYNETRKRESLANVKRLGYFEDVAFNTKTPPEKTDILNVDISVKERNTGSIQVGAGYSSYSGFNFTGDVQQSNFLGLGQKLGVSINLTNASSIFNFNFTEPYFMDSEWSLGFDVFRRQRKLTPYEEIKEGGAFRFGHPLAPYLYGYVRYKNDHTNLTLANGADPVIYPVETANGRTSSVTFTLEYDKRNDRYVPSDGVYGSMSLEYAGVGGEKKYTLGYATARYYQKIFWDLVFRNNLTYGYVTAPDGKPPFNELFLLGGANTLRGYEWFKIGRTKPSEIKNANGTGTGTFRDVPFGGQQQVFYNSELEFSLIGEAGIKGVLFYDVGYADDVIPFSALRSDIGFGFRWFSPIGPLRFEWGFPIDRRQGENATNFEFSIGSPF